MTFPESLRYTKDHEWIKLQGDIATVGITDFAQNELGDIVFVDINSVGDHLQANAVFGTIEAVKTVSDLYMPVSGEVIEFNQALTTDAELVNKDPYNEAWLIKVKVDNPAEVEALLSAAEYRAQIGH